MKTQLSYADLKSYAWRVALYLRETYPSGDYSLIAISRGGLTFGHLVAYMNAKPLSIFAPSANDLFPPPNTNNLIFLEDLIAKGRTYEVVNRFCVERNVNFEFIPVIVDVAVDLTNYPKVPMCYQHTSDWVVFPHEDFTHVDEGDHGLFREGSSNNAQALKYNAKALK